MQGFDENLEFLPIVADESEGRNLDPIDHNLPILALRNSVMFPGVVLPITVGREQSLKAVKLAYKRDKLVGVVSQNDPKVEDPEIEDLYEIGTVAEILKLIKMPDGSSTVIIRGVQRLRINEIVQSDPFFSARVELLTEDKLKKGDKELKAMMQSLKEHAKEIINLSANIPSEASVVINNIHNQIFLLHFVASNLPLDIAKKQEILATQGFKERLTRVLKHLDQELQLLEIKNEIQTKVKGDIEKQQRDYFLHQQMKTIQEELGGDSVGHEIKRLKKKAEKVKLSKDAKEKFEKELDKLQRTNPAAAEYSVILNYLDLLLDLPWEQFTKDSLDLNKAKKVLDKDHFGLDKIKDRILEYLAVIKLTKNLKSPILCFVGPPGVGKTSLGKSISKSINRKYIRMSLGGLHDESEIRGHRKTYIGAMPGRIIQSLKKVKSANPVFILDEIDKVGSDFRGDPSSALLEVLDSEQNNAFYDNYMELEFDLSKVMFIATANNLASIHPALRDRMEIIQLSGYSIEEKMSIAKKHLIPKQRSAHGVKATDFSIASKVLEKVIESYTRESGVRELDRTIAALIRNVAKAIVMEEKDARKIDTFRIEKTLGSAKFDLEAYKQENPPGIAVGLAYTVVGGDILFIETSISKGKGKLSLTGNLGDVMKESASTALSYLKTHAERLDINPNLFDKLDIHIHVPEGATPKDGPSAGITLLTALASNFSQRRVKPFMAMTGEITLRGSVLPVGGIKEKILAAKRAGMKEVIMHERNRKDVEQINKDYIKGLKVHFVQKMDEVLALALEPKSIRNKVDFDRMASLN